MSNDQADPSSIISTPSEALSETSTKFPGTIKAFETILKADSDLKSLPSCPTFRIPEEFWGGLEGLRANVRKERASQASNVPVSAPQPLPSPKS